VPAARVNNSSIRACCTSSRSTTSSSRPARVMPRCSRPSSPTASRSGTTAALGCAKRLHRVRSVGLDAVLVAELLPMHVDDLLVTQGVAAVLLSVVAGLSSVIARQCRSSASGDQDGGGDGEPPDRRPPRRCGRPPVLFRGAAHAEGDARRGGHRADALHGAAAGLAAVPSSGSSSRLCPRATRAMRT